MRSYYITGVGGGTIILKKQIRPERLEYTPEMLCRSCHDIFEAKSERIYHADRCYFKYHGSTRAFRAAAEAGCQLCASLWYQLPERIHDAAALTSIDDSFDSCGEEASLDLSYVTYTIDELQRDQGKYILEVRVALVSVQASAQVYLVRSEGT
jgi:hypothetical protein